ncbi:protein-L-isoaspartate O-methyltransferase [Microgenomates group bacterium RBG_16_45_19]|nr:MAG: protein-L-isoaspartate O-methyltransferase [Microgenomates group bacterium RBG_16_45_19]
MVAQQLQARDINDQRVLKAMATVPRHLFVPAHLSGEAYTDQALPIGHGQTISQPYMVAFTCQLCRLHGHETVLDIGTGSGYQAAVLSLLAKKVISLEIIPALAETAQTTLVRLGYPVQVIRKDGKLGYLPAAPYRAILSAAAAATPPPAWSSQLTSPGFIILPEGLTYHQVLVRYTFDHGSLAKETYFPVAYVPLV